MKAISIQQPFAFEIMSGRKTIEITTLDTLHRGDLLICSSKKPAFSQEEMEDIEDEYGQTFLYGQAICIVRLTDVRNVERGDEELALVDEADPDAFSWVLENPRPVAPFAVKGQKGLFDVDDSLIIVSPLKYDQPVIVKSGTVAQDSGIDFSGWHGRVSGIHSTEEGEPRIHVMWDSLSLREIPIPIIEGWVKEGFDWTGVLLRIDEIEPTEPRDAWEDVLDAIEEIVEDNPDIFEE